MSLYHTKAASWQDIARVRIPTSLGPGQDNRRSRVPKLRLFLSTNHLQASRDIRKTRRCQRFSAAHNLQAHLPQAAGAAPGAAQGHLRQSPYFPSCELQNQTLSTPSLLVLCKTVTIKFYSLWDVFITNNIFFKVKSGGAQANHLSLNNSK